MLHDKKIKNAKPKKKTYLLRDDDGLYLKVDTAGRKYWILRFWENGKEKQISLGVYPEVSLNLARVKRDELQTRRKNGELISLRPDKMPVNFQEASKDWLKTVA